MHPTSKGKQGYFGMKIHVGADVNSCAVHTVGVTAANEADINRRPKLLRPEDEVIFADAGYAVPHPPRHQAGRDHRRDASSRRRG